MLILMEQTINFMSNNKKGYEQLSAYKILEQNNGYIKVDLIN